MRSEISAAVLAFSLLAAAGPAIAAGTESASMPPDIAEKIRAFGRVINPPEVAPIYAPLQEKEPYKNVKIARDIKYGPYERNLLDVFAPDADGRPPRAVLIFVHGGAFTAGNKRAPGSPFYDNIALAAVRGGMVGVNMTYRLAPASQWPSANEDIAAAVRWVNDNIGTYGGDPKRIFLAGHSAGAVHVASYVSHPEFHGPQGSGLAGAILLSGLFDLTSMTPGAPEKAYYGDDASKYAERSSLQGLIKTQVPLLVVHAELDPPFMVDQANQLKDALCKQSKCPAFLRLANHSHMSEVYAVNSKDTELADAILAFVNKPN